nr:protein kinase-like domain-containing protein [Tanacetum cinerariifolium]
MTIVHGDLKPSNILLDADMVAHVGDFGLARLLCTDLNQNNSRGLKEQLVMHLLISSIGDVYSFGILLLEVMTGKKPIDGIFNEGLSLHKFAYMALPDHVIDVIDDDAIVLQSTEMNAKKVEECLAATIRIGVSCSVDSPPERMKIEIVVSLIPCLHCEVESNCSKEREETRRKSGGNTVIMDSLKFTISDSTIGDGLLALSGKWIPYDARCLFVVCGKTGHFKRDCRNGNKKNNTNAGGSEKGSKDQSQDKWIDSGATTYVCKYHYWFKTYEPMEEGFVLYMGDDHLLMFMEKEVWC